MKTDVNTYFVGVLVSCLLQSRVQSPDPNKSTNDKIEEVFNAFSKNQFL